MRARSAIVTVAAALALASHAGAQEAPPRDEVAMPRDVVAMPAIVKHDIVLSGRISMTRDVVIARGATLTLAPGAHVSVSASDAGKGGVDPKRCELHVHGRILVAGDEERPVSIVGRGPKSWFGIVLHRDRARTPDSALSHLRLSGAWVGVQVADGRPRISNAVFDNCTHGVSAGRLYADEALVIEQSRTPEPELERCLFTRCKVGVFTEYKASPGVRRTTFIDCGTALGNDRIGRQGPMHGIGARVSRALFVNNRCAVLGSASVQDSIFVGNDVALSVTTFHHKLSQNTDRIGWRANVFHDNAAIARGESDLGSGHLFVDPQLSGTPVVTSLATAVTPPPGARLQPGSPVRGTATDGGDPGPFGNAAPGRRRRAWSTRGAIVESAYVLGPFDALSTLKVGRPPRLFERGAPMQRADLRWAKIETGGRVGLCADIYDWPDDRPVVMTFAVDLGGAAGSLEINADGRIAGWVDGTPLAVPSLRGRWGSRGGRVRIPAGAGVRELTLVWSDRDTGGVIGVAVHAGEGADVAFTTRPEKGGNRLAVTPAVYPDQTVGFRVAGMPNWLDLETRGRVRVIDGKRNAYDLCDLFPTLDRRGLVRLTLPPGVDPADASLEFVSFRDAHGRRFGGQPLTVPFVSRR